MKLENWSIVSTEDPYKAPEQRLARLHGTVFGHSRFDDGETITTSPVVEQKDGIVVTQSGSRYELGSIDPEYAKIYPDAKRRLFDSLQLPITK